MPAYLVRLQSTRELLGLFVSEPNDLWMLVDECCDPGACEYKLLTRGGIYQRKAGAPAIPTIYRDEHEVEETAPDWFAGATLSEHWHDLFETEKGNRGWEALS